VTPKPRRLREYHAAEELEEMGMIGVYERPELVILIF
jgi:hypothetical protein